MNEKLRVGVIFGGRSGEHEVSLMSARSVLAAIDRTRYEVVEIGISRNGDWLVGDNVLESLQTASQSGKGAHALAAGTLLPLPARPTLYKIHPDASAFLHAGATSEPETQSRATPRVEALEALADLDVIFPVLHGTFGEDGTLQGLLELADLAYVGAGVLGAAVGMDKGVFKDVMRAQGIPVLEGFVVLRSEIEKNPQAVLAQAEEMAPFPLFVKPANLGSSVGVTKCRTRSDLYEGLLEAARYDRRILIERGIEAREIEVSVIGNDDPAASIPGEIVPSGDFYTYAAKYLDERSQLLIPAPVSEAVIERARALALQAYRAIDCAGMARVDFLLEKSASLAPEDHGGLYLNEVNTIPGFTEISMYSKLWEASGLSYSALVDRLIELALERKAQRDRIERQYEMGR